MEVCATLTLPASNAEQRSIKVSGSVSQARLVGGVNPGIEDLDAAPARVKIMDENFEMGGERDAPPAVVSLMPRDLL